MNRLSLAVAAAGFVLIAGCKTGTHGVIGSYKIGEKVQVGPLIYTVFEAQNLTNIGEGLEARLPKGRFLVIHLSVVNGGGNSDQQIPTVTLVDDQGESYTELDNGAGVPQWLGLARKVRPAESLTGDVIFDVPPKHYQLRIPDELDDRFALVDIPPTFGLPEVRIDPLPSK
ncbi:MAG: DUF4352 domain-containing protein [Acidobacteriota bacterium]|nr:DUF4352 domain-containing protein [Acidobacteriota bacterium]